MLNNSKAWKVLWTDDRNLFDSQNCIGNGWDVFENETDAKHFIEGLLHAGIEESDIVVLPPCNIITDIKSFLSYGTPQEGCILFYLNYNSCATLTTPVLRKIELTGTEALMHLDLGSTDECPDGEIRAVSISEVGKTVFFNKADAVDAVRRKYGYISEREPNSGCPFLIKITEGRYAYLYRLMAITGTREAYYLSEENHLIRSNGTDWDNAIRDSVGIYTFDSLSKNGFINTHDYNTGKIMSLEVDMLLDPQTRWLVKSKNLPIEKTCKVCGRKTVYEHPDVPGLFLSTSDNTEGDICMSCMVEHCCSTNCLGCDIGKYPDCKFLYLKND